MRRQSSVLSGDKRQRHFDRKFVGDAVGHVREHSLQIDVSAVATLSVPPYVIGGIYVLIADGEVHLAFGGHPSLTARPGRKRQQQQHAQDPVRAHPAPEAGAPVARRFMTASITARNSSGLAGALSTRAYCL